MSFSFFHSFRSREKIHVWHVYRDTNVCIWIIKIKLLLQNLLYMWNNAVLWKIHGRAMDRIRTKLLSLFAIISLLWYLAGKLILNFSLFLCLYFVYFGLWSYENLDKKEILRRRIKVNYSRESSSFDEIQNDKRQKFHKEME